MAAEWSAEDLIDPFPFPRNLAEILHNFPQLSYMFLEKCLMALHSYDCNVRIKGTRISFMYIDLPKHSTTGQNLGPDFFVPSQLFLPSSSNSF